MNDVEVALVTTAAAFVVALLFVATRTTSRRSRALERLFDDDRVDLPGETRAAVVPIVRPRRWVGPLAFALAAVAFVALDFPPEIAVTAALVVGALGWIVDRLLVARTAGRLEAQLGDAIDVVTGALGAGVSVTEALEHAARESAEPLRTQLTMLCRRLRLGDDPHAAIEELSERAPLETYRLFTFTLSTHWDVGGSLTPTLATVGRAIRDRTEIERRVRAQAVESQLSVVGILAITYGLLAIQWAGDPGRMEGFLLSAVGTYATAGVLALQALGLVWMTRLSTIEV